MPCRDPDGSADSRHCRRLAGLPQLNGSAAGELRPPLSPGRPRSAGWPSTAAGAVLVLGAGVTRGVRDAGEPRSLVSSAAPVARTSRCSPSAAPAGLDVTPTAGAKGVNGMNPIRVQFSEPLARVHRCPPFPPIPGSWQVRGRRRGLHPRAGVLGEYQGHGEDPRRPGWHAVGCRTAAAAAELLSANRRARPSLPARSAPCDCSNCSPSSVTCRWPGRRRRRNDQPDRRAGPSWRPRTTRPPGRSRGRPITRGT